MNKIKKITALLMVPVFLMLCACGAVDENNNDDNNSKQVKYTTPAGLVKKTETVYVNLDSNGNKTKAIVSDWLHTDRAQVYVTDTTSLSEIENIKDDSVPDKGENGTIKWYMNTTDLYYQGESNKELPLNFEITYALNGVPSVPSEIIGKSGKIDITIKMHNTDVKNVNKNGKVYTMYNPLLVVGGVALSESKFQNISVKNGRTTGNGNTQVAVLVGFPGINDSLGLSSGGAQDDSSFSFDDTFVISADVTDFELGNIMFAALPIASLNLGLNNISSSINDVKDNLSKLQSIQRSLQSIDADGLLNTLSSNPNKMNELSSLVSQAANLYDNNKALINVLNKYSTPSNIETIQFLTAYISQADFDGLENALGVINSFFGNEADTAKLQEGINLLRELSNDLKNEQVQAAVQNLPRTISTLSALQKAINENKDLINALETLSNSNALASVNDALSGLEGSIAAGGISQFATITGSADEIAEKMTAWIELGKRYTIFTKKCDYMDSSVMFVYKVDALKAGAESKAPETKLEVEESSGLGSVFKKIFG